MCFPFGARNLLVLEIWAPLKKTVTSLILEVASRVSMAQIAVLDMISEKNKTRFFIDKEFRIT